jgi:cell division protein FtsI/penicillin-binding protein 2
MAGKTATAQVRLSEAGQVRLFNNCALAAYAPLHAPQIVVLVLAQVEREREGSGASVAGPAVKRIVEETLRYWGVEPGGAR